MFKLCTIGQQTNAGVTLLKENKENKESNKDPLWNKLSFKVRVLIFVNITYILINTYHYQFPRNI